MKMNLPNKLTVLRLCLVPVILVIGILPETIIPYYISCVICATLFIGTAVTDMLDGKIARRDGLITDFGKFLDPIADKFMVIGAMFVLLVVVFRELAVTSMRLVVSTGEGIVIAANYLGKIKTVSQIVAVSTVFLEPVVQLAVKFIVNLIADGAWQFEVGKIIPLTYLTLAFTVVMTVWSGLNYIKSYWKYLDPQK